MKFIEKISSLQKSGDHLLVMDFHTMPRVAFVFAHGLYHIFTALGVKAPDPHFGYEVNVNDQKLREQFSDYEPIHSYGFIFFFARSLIHHYHLPVWFVRLLPWPKKYYFALLKKR